MSLTYTARHAKPYDIDADVEKLPILEIVEMTEVAETGPCQMEGLGVEHSGLGTLRVNAYNQALHSDDGLHLICDACDGELKRLVATDGE